MKILKFGGSSLSTPATIRAVGAILSAARRRDPLVVVVAAYVNQKYPATFVDARDFVVTDDQFTHANVNFRRTNRAVRRAFAGIARRFRHRVIPVVTGFIGATEDGQTTTIGRNGSDYSA